MDKYFDVQCPDKDFSGYCIIDMEWWVPDLDSCPAIYKQKSIEKVLKENPTLLPTDQTVLQLATSQFNNAAQILMEQTLIRAKQLRPKGKWGYYGYPARCYFSEGGLSGYLNKQRVINDRYTKIWAVSDVIYPSLYVIGSYRSNNDPVKLEFNKTWAKENVEEAVRIAKGKPVVAYIWYLYENDMQLQQEADYRTQVEAAYKYGANGVILWQHDYTETELKRVVSFFEGVGGKVHRELGLIK
jgi:hyaluronoglucosaminidase